MPAKASKPRVPSGLGSAGKRLWADTVGLYRLRVDELRVLEQACRTLDGIGELEKALKGEPRTTRGSKGQPVAHPLIAELRSERLAFRALVHELGLPDPSTVKLATQGQRSSRARAAANARWRSGG